jgi:hypothetical protein
MDVLVHLKPRHRWLRPKKPSVLGGGLLERVRSTTLALLGVTTAVGLAMVALALNQSWPLVADSPIPGISAPHEAVGRATVAAQARAEASAAGSARTADLARRGSARAVSGDDVGAQAPRAGAAPPPSAELVVAPSAPAEPRGDAPGGAGDPSPAPSPAGTSPQAPASPVPASEPAQPEPAPSSPPVVEATPPPTSAEVPVDPSDDDDEWDDDDDHGDDDDDWGGHDWRDHDRGHHWSRGRDDD